MKIFLDKVRTPANPLEWEIFRDVDSAIDFISNNLNIEVVSFGEGFVDVAKYIREYVGLTSYVLHIEDNNEVRKINNYLSQNNWGTGFRFPVFDSIAEREKYYYLKKRDKKVSSRSSNSQKRISRLEQILEKLIKENEKVTN